MNNHVGMGFEQCPICLKHHTETVLLATKYTRGRNGTMEPLRRVPARACTGHSLCPEHEAMRTEYLALVEATGAPGETLKPEDATLTGNVCHIRRTVAKEIFNIPVSAHPFVYVEVGVIDRLQSMHTA